MKLAFGIGTAQRDWQQLRSFASEAERIGVDSVWSAESIGHDAFTPLAFIAGQTTKLGLGTGVVTLGSRSAAMTAMSAVSLASMSNGRFILGLGANSREALENWHGQPFPPASRNLIETTEIIHKLARGEPLVYAGRVHSLPKDQGFSRAMEPGLANSFPIYFASLSPKSLEATGTVADGWVGGASFSPMLADTFWGPIRAGAQHAERSLKEFDFMAPAFLFPGREQALGITRSFLAGILGKQGDFAYSHHAAVYERAGYGDLMVHLSGCFAAGKAEDAAAAVPEELAFDRCLAGTDEEIRQTLRNYRNCGVTTVQAYWFGGGLLRALEPLARVKSLLDEVNLEPDAGQNQKTEEP